MQHGSGYSVYLVVICSLGLRSASCDPRFSVLPPKPMVLLKDHGRWLLNGKDVNYLSAFDFLPFVPASLFPTTNHGNRRFP
jgi:hypothetical protein